MMILLHHIRVNEIDHSGKNCSEKHRKSPDGFWPDCTLYNIGFKVLILNLNFF